MGIKVNVALCKDWKGKCFSYKERRTSGWLQSPLVIGCTEQYFVYIRLIWVSRFLLAEVNVKRYLLKVPLNHFWFQHCRYAKFVFSPFTFSAVFNRPVILTGLFQTTLYKVLTISIFFDLWLLADEFLSWFFSFSSSHYVFKTFSQTVIIFGFYINLNFYDTVWWNIEVSLFTILF